jgi:hypothetical protein
VTFELQKQVIVLCGTRRIYASVRALSRGLAGHLNLRRRLADRRIGKVENLTKNVVFHRYFVSSMPDLDEEVGQ